MSGAVLLHRATLADIPAVARLLLPPMSPILDGVALSREESAGALRLGLAHIGLDSGGVWVAEDAEGVLSAAALLPPQGLVDNSALLLSLHLDLGLGTGRQPVRLSVGGPEGHWLLLIHEGATSLLSELVRRALESVVGSTVAVVCPPDGEAPEVLLALGFAQAEQGVFVRPVNSQ